MNNRRTLKEKICGYALKKSGSEPEYLWLRLPGYCVFRRGDCRKW